MTVFVFRVAGGDEAALKRDRLLDRHRHRTDRELTARDLIENPHSARFGGAPDALNVTSGHSPNTEKIAARGGRTAGAALSQRHQRNHRRHDRDKCHALSMHKR